jgi:hypothetical protein
VEPTKQRHKEKKSGGDISDGIGSYTRPSLDHKFFLKFHYAKRRFPIISKFWQMHGVLNIDEIKN